MCNERLASPENWGVGAGGVLQLYSYGCRMRAKASSTDCMKLGQSVWRQCMEHVNMHSQTTIRTVGSWFRMLAVVLILDFFYRKNSCIITHVSFMSACSLIRKCFLRNRVMFLFDFCCCIENNLQLESTVYTLQIWCAKTVLINVLPP